MTPNMRKVLEYLNDKMEASSRSLGRAVYPTSDGGMDKREISAIGASIAGHLRRQGYVTFLSDLRAWRITKAGRSVLAES